MARVIKGAGQQAPRRQMAKLRPTGGKKVIEKELYRAQQEGAEILAKAEEEKAQLIAEAKQKAAQAREEAQAEGAQEAFETAAAEALEAFRRRALRYGEAADDIRVLALEVSKKILGGNLKLDPEEIDEVVQSGMASLRARRKLRIQVPPDRQQALLKERPRLVAQLDEEPDLVLEAIGDVSPGRARIVTEPGGALCSEQVALDFVAEALEVDEQAVAPTPQSAVIDVPSEEQEALRTSSAEDRSDEEVWDGLASDDEEATAFLPSRQRNERAGTEPIDRDDIRRARKRSDIHRVATDRNELPPEQEQAERERRRRRRAARKAEQVARAAPSDVDRTMALDVSQLREDLVDPPSDELDLFADDAVHD